ncbi:Retrotransposon protein [Seminavis robusta]|uniref:Retrotransposon protein n=1 Tax=Seminavis robusta TaxID=568900 RepID=A0A9N8HZ56_9STRA|nr:Retrotransposon protein [Seminavis robusta]|eukprot:Sro3239_g345770.1 Retrotransposon protein (458) ;mRNA; f:2391-4100
MSAAAPRTADRDKLKHVVTIMLNNDETNWETHEVMLALTHFGVDTFSDLMMMERKDIESLVVPVTGTVAEHPLGFSQRRQLLAAICCFHHFCREQTKSINVTSISFANFQQFRIGRWDPSAEVVPWLTTRAPVSAEAEIEHWNKTVKISRSDYKEFRYTPENPSLDRIQREWMYKTLCDTIKTAAGKSFLTQHLNDSETRLFWEKMSNHYKTSMTATIRSSSTYLTTANLSDGSWRGSQQNFILNFKEQGRIYNGTSVHDKYSDGQLVQFLEQAVSGVPNLSGARRVDMLARAAAKNVDTYTFEDYTASLLSLAAIYDAAHSGTSRSRGNSRRSSYNHELIFEQDDENHGYESHVHDFDTTIDELLEPTSMTSSRSHGSLNPIMKPALHISSHTLDEKKNKVSSDTDLLHLATHVVQDSTTVPDLLSGNIANVLSQPSSCNVSFSNEVRYHELDEID